MTGSRRGPERSHSYASSEVDRTTWKHRCEPVKRSADGRDEWRWGRSAYTRVSKLFSVLARKLVSSDRLVGIGDVGA